MSLFRPQIDRIAGYVPGEQPQESGWTKLNTNENPYPPSPRVVAAIQASAEGRLNVYPDPLARQFCRAAGKLLGVDPESVLPANGSDENLTILMRSFVDAGEQVAYPYPSYVLYETLGAIQGAQVRRIPLRDDWSWDQEAAGPIVEGSKLVFVPNPNSPSGNLWSMEEIERLVPAQGVLVLDEAYEDFVDEPNRCEVLSSACGDRIVVTRTLSKSYSLAGIRFGFAVARPELIAGMRKVKDSYNCDTLTLAAAVAAIEDQAWMLSNRERILKTRTRLTAALRQAGFQVVDSQANFVWATHDSMQHESIYSELKRQKVLVRYMRFDRHSSAEEDRLDGLRITVGTDEEVDRFLDVLGTIVS